MREELKQQLRNMVGTLGRAEAVLDSRIRKKDDDSLGSLFEDMQNAAIEIGNTIELVEGEGTETVKRLEEYCELIWQYMVETELKERFRIGRLLAGKRGEVISTLETEFAGDIDVVFLLCKASGWKNMEHFYTVAEEKAECCLMMAPYMEYSSDGTENEIRESELLPESVKAEAYEDYDLEEEKPDIVFVDGPYWRTEEGGNAPGYDFMKIRKNAGLLIYVPYYKERKSLEMSMDGGSGSEEEAATVEARNEALAKECARDCMSPQVQHSDIILVPTKEVGEAYINALNQVEGGREIIERIYQMDALNGEKLFEKGMKAVRAVN